MKLVNAEHDLRIDLKEDKITTLVIEHPQVMTEIVSELQKQVNGEEGNFILSENFKEIKISKCLDIIVNPFAISLNNKKTLNKLYAQLTDVAQDFIEEKAFYNQVALNLIDNILTASAFQELTYQFDIEWNSLFKLYDVKFEDTAESLLERVIEYMRVLSSLFYYKVIILVGIKNYLDTDELKELYQMAHYFNLYLILIESVERELFDNEICYIIDKDRCLIVK